MNTIIALFYNNKRILSTNQIIVLKKGDLSYTGRIDNMQYSKYKSLFVFALDVSTINNGEILKFTFKEEFEYSSPFSDVDEWTKISKDDNIEIKYGILINNEINFIPELNEYIDNNTFLLIQLPNNNYIHGKFIGFKLIGDQDTDKIVIDMSEKYNKKVKEILLKDIINLNIL